MLQSRDNELQEKDVEIASMKAALQSLQEEVARLSEHKQDLRSSNENHYNDAEERAAKLQTEADSVHEHWKQSAEDLIALQRQHVLLTSEVDSIIREEIEVALADKNDEVEDLRAQLAYASQQISTLRERLSVNNAASEYLNDRDEDFFENACHELSQHVQQWVVRYSKFSDARPARTLHDVADANIQARLRNAVLNGTDVDAYLGHRVRRRDVLMSIVMAMIREFVFTRYFFGMDRDQRQKLKNIERALGEVGPHHAVAHWRATTLTLLSRRQVFQEQRDQDIRVVAGEVWRILTVLLPPPEHMISQLMESLNKVVALAVSLSIEMRTQRAEYIMLPLLQPEQDEGAGSLRKIYFSAALMHERTGLSGTDQDHEARSATVGMVLFPLVVKKGDQEGKFEAEVVIYPAQVLIA